MKYFVVILLLTGACGLSAQNTLGGKAIQVPEAEVERQSQFVEAERERLVGRHDKAIALYKEFLRKNPGNDAAWFGLARAHAARQEFQEALDATGKAAEKNPQNPWYLVYQADLFEKTGRVKDAAAGYEKLTKQFPQTPEFWERLAYLAVLDNDPKGGLKALDQLEKLRGVTEDLCMKRHLIYVGLGDNKKAAAELRKLADTYPTELEYRHRLAQFYKTIGEQANARAVYAEILRRNPDDPEAKLALLDNGANASEIARVQALQPLFADPRVPIDAKIKELLPYFEKMKPGVDPALAGALLSLGAALEKTHPDDPKAWSASGDLLYFAGKPADALEKYRRCLKLNPGVFSVWANTLEILTTQGQHDEALTVAEQAMDAFPNQPLAYYHYGRAAIEKNRPDDALPPLEQALLMAGNNLALRLDILDQIGLALLRKKDVAGALARYEQALAKGGDKHPGTLEHYGDALYLSGEADKARTYWQKAYDLLRTPALEQKIATGKL